jgi:preprotein translocase subunit SecA
VVVALTGLHACRRDEHYVVREGRIDLLDEVSGRIAEGRVWSRGLHTVVALKEGVSAPPETDTVAQTTFQRFFQRYWRLGGISGTLWEARHELREVYGTPVERIALHRPCRREALPPQAFADDASRLAALVPRVAALQAAGRPVLVGTDSVAESLQVAGALAAHGVPHRVLNALHDADEAAIVALAGCAGQVTVATRMAGRGTDIGLDAAARAAGGLHVLSFQNNPSRRLDRQLAGRAGRAGDPGSSEVWALRDLLPHALERSTPRLEEWTDPTPSPPRSHRFLARWLSLRRRFRQAREDRRRAALRHALLQQDREWEQRLSFAGPPR